MHIHGSTPNHLACMFITCLVVLVGCGDKPRSQKNPLADFGIDLFEAAKANNVDTLVAKFCANKKDALAYLGELKQKNPGLQFADDAENVTDADIEKSHRDSIAIFINSYKDELAGDPVNYSAAIAKELGSTKLIVWAKMPDGSYRGVLIESVIKTSNGYKVNDWLGPIADPTKKPSSLRRKKAILKSETRDGCVFPRESIQYEYEFVT